MVCNSRIRASIQLWLPIMALIACSNSARAEKYLDKLPLSEIEFLNQATEVEVYAIPPHPKSQDPQGIAGYPILAKAQLGSSEPRKILIAALSNAIRLGGPMMACFDPHHAIRFAKNGEAHDFVICFECGEARELISRAGQPVEEIGYGVSVMYAEPFNTILEATAPKFREKSNLFTIESVAATTLFKKVIARA